MQNEIWKEIKGTGGLYSISTKGRVLSSRYGMIKTPPMQTGYKHFNMSIYGKMTRGMVHREVAVAFIDQVPGKTYVNHIDGNKSNNNIENLEWCTCSENSLHSFRVLGQVNSRNPERQKAVLVYKDDLPVVLTFDGLRECGRFLSIPYQSIQRTLKFPKYRCYGWRVEYL